MSGEPSPQHSHFVPGMHPQYVMSPGQPPPRVSVHSPHHGGGEAPVTIQVHPVENQSEYFVVNEPNSYQHQPPAQVIVVSGNTPPSQNIPVQYMPGPPPPHSYHMHSGQPPPFDFSWQMPMPHHSPMGTMPGPPPPHFTLPHHGPPPPQRAPPPTEALSDGGEPAECPYGNRCSDATEEHARRYKHDAGWRPLCIAGEKCTNTTDSHHSRFSHSFPLRGKKKRRGKGGPGTSD